MKKVRQQQKAGLRQGALQFNITTDITTLMHMSVGGISDIITSQTYIPIVYYLFFIKRTSLFLLESSTTLVCPDCPTFIPEHNA